MGQDRSMNAKLELVETNYQNTVVPSLSAPAMLTLQMELRYGRGNKKKSQNSMINS